MDNDCNQSDTFFDSVHFSQLLAMLDILPGTLFWVKNAKGEIVHGNEAFLAHIGVSSLHQIIGQTDLAFAPAHLAHQYMVDDEKVMAGQLVTERLEVNQPEGSDDLAWYVTSKRPLYSSQGEIVGTYGMSKKLHAHSCTQPGMSALKTPVEYIRANFAQPLKLTEIAEASHLSVSALERRFKKHLNITPKQFLTQVRLEQARKLLIETNDSISEIAFSVGFTDHSYFSRQFQLYFSEQPREVKKHYHR
ncbi:helix-turn-helix domain-containing protein [Pseudoalteromonas rubra]|uniref:Helix-turn-helix domain-containing protein n=1 Tax=Pseudoalteromonas rubra TaxID=43658 RepID=A0A5S3UWE4_9GAMM|nr:AraC family transcriptional regulator [Pseudoalteromonas rubra]QPB83321.1 helix-turn-helix domain-containing protein [Pseudoalteromonas rubra]